MSTLTLRGIDERIADTLKERAKKEKSSVNALMLRIIKESLGLEKKKRRTLHDDLNHLAGTWSEQEATEFAQTITHFESVDENLWN